MKHVERHDTKVIRTDEWPAGASWLTVLSLLEPVWDFMRLSQPLASADAIVAMGSNDLSTARYAASLFHEGLAPVVAVSGGVAHKTDLLATGWGISEAEAFARVALDLGVPENALIIENQASNTAENFEFVRESLARRNIAAQSLIVVHKPFMERRAFATGRKLWPDLRFVVTSIPCSMKDYLLFSSSPSMTINVMLGDLQRIRLYGERGFMEVQQIPDSVWASFEKLVAMGFDRHLQDVCKN